MQMVETALGRLVPVNEADTYLEDAILRLLFEYRVSPGNPGNAPLTLSEISRSVVADRVLVLAALDALRGLVPPLVEQRDDLRGEKTFGITPSGVRFVRNLPQASSGFP